MEAIRGHRLIHDQENVNVVKRMGSGAVLAKKGGLAVRGALGDRTNIDIQHDPYIGKVAGAAAEFEKKASLNRAALKTNYSHVQPKVDTGRLNKPVQPSSRPPLRRNENIPPKPLAAATKTVTVQPVKPTLRREESTAGHAVKAVTSRVLKEVKPSELEELNIFIQTKKSESRKANKLPTVRENKVLSVKPILKESTESLEKLKLNEKSSSKHENLDITPELPGDIEDIDAGDNNSPLLMPTYIKDIYRYLRELEEKYPIQENHLKNQSVISGRMRATLVDWLVEVHIQFSLMLETFQLAIGIIDRYLQAKPNLQRNQLQLVGVTAMLIASKYEEIYPPDVGDFVFITDMAYTKAQIFQCERDIMTKLGFCLARPIPLSFLRRFVKAAHGTSKNHHLAKYLVDLCLLEYSMAHYRPSELAAAAICLSLYLLSSKNLEEVWTPTLSYYSGYEFHEIEPIIRKIAKVASDVDNTKFKSVSDKYASPSLARVSTLPQLRSDVLLELVHSP